MNNSKRSTTLPFLKTIENLLQSWHWRRILFWLGATAGIFIILYLVFLGQYIRPFQDDFYYYPPIEQKEMYDLLHERYTWTGRFSSTTVHVIVGWLGIHWIVPLISLSIMIAGIYALLRVLVTKFFRVATSANRKLSLLLALGLTLGMFLVMPSPYSAVYWLSAAPIHFWSYGLILLYSAYLLKHSFDAKRTLRPIDYGVMAVVPLVIGMLGEIAMFTLAALVGVVALFAIINKTKKLALMIIPNVLGVGAAFYALFFSLGAIIRRGAEEAAPFSEVISHAPYVILKNVHALVFHLMNNKIVLIMIFLVAVILGMYYLKEITNKQRLLLIVVGVTLVGGALMCLNFVGVYSSVRLNVAWSRTQAFSVIIIISLLMLYGAIFGALLKEYLLKKGNVQLIRRIKQGIMLVVGVIVLLNLGFLPYIGKFGANIQDRATAYDKREEYIYQIKNKGNISCPVELPVTHLVGTQENMDLFQDPAHAVNAGVVRYHRLPCQIMGE